MTVKHIARNSLFFIIPVLIIVILSMQKVLHSCSLMLYFKTFKNREGIGACKNQLSNQSQDLIQEFYSRKFYKQNKISIK